MLNALVVLPGSKHIGPEMLAEGAIKFLLIV